MNLKSITEGILFVVGDEGTTIKELSEILEVNEENHEQNAFLAAEEFYQKYIKEVANVNSLDDAVEFVEKVIFSFNGKKARFQGNERYKTCDSYVSNEEQKYTFRFSVYTNGLKYSVTVCIEDLTMATYKLAGGTNYRYTPKLIEDIKQNILQKTEVHKSDTYQIYQLKEDAPRELCFERYSRIKACDFKNYDKVYEAPLINQSLEGLYIKFQRFDGNVPDDFKGHSLSVSDVVVLKKDNKEEAWYCDSIGFQSVPEFIKTRDRKIQTTDKVRKGTAR